jgi:ABC-2 type transport system ATP-binding protein
MSIEPNTTITMRGVSHRFGRTVVLDGLDLTVPEGAMYALLGPNGAGKTTLLRLLTGIDRVQRGAAEIFGTPVHALTIAQRQRIAYVAEGQRLPSWMRMEQLEAYCAPLYPSWDFSLASSLRARFDLDPRATVGKMSRGQRMKAALLLALAPRPPLLLMDEPLTGMDVAVKDELVRGLLDVASTEGQTVLMSTHDIVEIETVLDWVGFLTGSCLALEGPVDALRERYRRLELQLSTRASDVRVPETWMQVERAGNRLVAVVPVAHEIAPSVELTPTLAALVRERAERPLTLKELYLLVQATSVAATSSAAGVAS